MPETIPRRPKEAYNLFKKGLSVKQIAQKMSISPSTVRSYIYFARSPKKYLDKMTRRREKRIMKKKMKRQKGSIYLKDVKADLQKS